MTSNNTNLFLTELGTICREHPVREKWILAPSFRTGYQWLDRLALCCQPVLNGRIKTMRSMALDLTAPSLSETGRSLLRDATGRSIIDELFEQLIATDQGYLCDLTFTSSLIDALHRVVQDLRLAGIAPEEMDEDYFEVTDKGRQLRWLLEKFISVLDTEMWADPAMVLEIARDRLTKQPVAIPEGTLVLMPEDGLDTLSALEQQLWHAIGDEHKRLVPVDDVQDNAPCLCSGNAQVFGAVGEVNEVREVVRRCLHNGEPWDDIEIIVTDRETYLPLLHEAAARLNEETTDKLPMSFADGIGAGFTRPVRALLAWLDWQQSRFAQAKMVRMIQDGLLLWKLPDDLQTGPVRLGEVLREVPIGHGHANYLPQIDRTMLVWENELTENKDPGEEKKRRRLERKIRILKHIRKAISDLLPGPDTEDCIPPEELFKKATGLVQQYARVTNRFDASARAALLSEIEELGQSYRGHPSASLDPFAELLALARSLRVERQGPLPGTLFVSSLRYGGHSGRSHTYILGLDDSRFPGAGLQDPLLLDQERERLSDSLPTAQTALARKSGELSRLLARLRGHVSLSFCCRSLSDDRRMFPNSALMKAYRTISGDRTGDQKSFFEWLDPPVSFAPIDSDTAADSTEWWLSTLLTLSNAENAWEMVEQAHPHLGQGRVAEKARQSDRFTEYDGYVPEAGADRSPYRKDAQPVSARQLEKFGSCPLDYFFKHVLGISPPEEHGLDETVWLNRRAQGNLLHEVFRAFMVELKKADLIPDFERDWPLLGNIVSQKLADAREKLPPPSEEMFDRECRDVEKVAAIFLREEVRNRAHRVPAHFEVSIGLPPEGEGTLLDCVDPVRIALPNRKYVAVRGRIDRVDEVSLDKATHYALLDYKTGKSDKYNQSDPFRSGRFVQPILYLEMLSARLAQMKDRLEPDSFAYLFLSLRELGMRMEWEARDLAPGREILTGLCDLIAAGCFPETDNHEDVTYSDYSVMREDQKKASECAKEKIINPDNDVLAPFADLRNLKRKDGNG